MIRLSSPPQMTSAEAVHPPRAWVGQSYKRIEDGRLLTGTGRFIDDLEPLPGIVHAEIVRCPHTHARVDSLAAAARQTPGVLRARADGRIRYTLAPRSTSRPTG
jgi:2-furoyl-CoA dehydrogenase large subunit